VLLSRGSPDGGTYQSLNEIQRKKDVCNHSERKWQIKSDTTRSVPGATERKNDLPDHSGMIWQVKKQNKKQTTHD
jgi:hypothetical protein